MASVQPPKHGTELTIVFPIFDADGDLISGAASLDSEVSKDGGSFVDCTNEATEIGTSGMYSLTLTATEMTAYIVAVLVKTSTVGAKTTPMVFYPADNTIDDIATVLDDVHTHIDAASFITAQQVWEYATRTLSSGGTGTTAQEVWEYATRTLSALPTGAATEAKQDIIDAIVDAIKVKTDLIPAEPAAVGSAMTLTAAYDAAKTPDGFKKNTAFSNFKFMMFDSTTKLPTTGKTITATRLIDGGTFASCANSVTELASGWYSIDLAASDLNGDSIAFRFAATGALDTNISIITVV